jgi:hypothetical protein
MHLVDRLGLFGVRLTTTLIRAGEVGSATELAARLADVSGLGELRAALLRQFTERSRLLRARSALAAVRAVVRRGGCTDAGMLAAAAEEVTASAHEFVEIRLLNDLRAGFVQVPGHLEEEMDRLLGGSGHSTAGRLGLPESATADECRAGALDALARWQKVATSPLSDRRLQLAAQGVARTCEGILAELATT